MTSPSRTPGVLTVAAAFGIVALSVYLLVVGEEILMPLVLAIFITYLIAALGNRIERLRIRAWHPPGWLGLTGAIILLLLLIAVAVQITAGNIQDVVAAAPAYQDRLQMLFAQGMSKVVDLFKLNEAPTFTTLAQRIDISDVVRPFAAAFKSLAADTFQVFAYVAFLLLELRFFDRKLKAIFPEPGQEHFVRATLGAMGRKIETYVLLKSAISLLSAVLSYIILRLFSVDFAGFWALLVFVLNFIPYIGAPLAMLFPTVLALLQFGSWFTAVFVLACLIGVQTFIDNVVDRPLTGHSLNLSPVVLILSLSTWGAVWGITGMILSVPLMVIMMIVFAQFPKTRPIAVLLSANGDVGERL